MLYKSGAPSILKLFAVAADHVVAALIYRPLPISFVPHANNARHVCTCGFTSALTFLRSRITRLRLVARNDGDARIQDHVPYRLSYGTLNTFKLKLKAYSKIFFRPQYFLSFIPTISMHVHDYTNDNIEFGMENWKQNEFNLIFNHNINFDNQNYNENGSLVQMLMKTAITIRSSEGFNVQIIFLLGQKVQR